MKVILTGGGSGGHFYPALAIAEEFRKNDPDVELLYLGHEGYIESREAPAHNIPFKSVPSRGLEMPYGFIRNAGEVAITGFSMAAGIVKARSIIKRFRPDIAVGTGGFVSFPVIMAAQSLGIKTYLHEQNAAPGRGNRRLARKARKIMIGFPGTEDSLGYPEKTVYTGNPVRSDFANLDKSLSRQSLGIPDESFVVFSVGGSLGAETINKIALEYAGRIKDDENKYLISGTGSLYYEDCVGQAKNEGIELGNRIRMEGYIQNMKDCIAASDLVICRAGAVSIAELLVAGRPSIIIPYSGSVGDHQYYNAKSVQDAGGAVMYREEDADPIVVCNRIEELSRDLNGLKEMGKACAAISPKDARRNIYSEIITDYEKDQ